MVLKLPEAELSVIVRVVSGAISIFGLLILTASIEIFIEISQFARNILMALLVLFLALNLIIAAYRKRLLVWSVWLVFGSAIGLIVALLPYRYLLVFFLLSMGLNKDFFDSLGKRILVGEISEHTPIIAFVGLALLLVGEKNILLVLPSLFDVIADTIQDIEAVFE